MLQGRVPLALHRSGCCALESRFSSVARQEASIGLWPWGNKPALNWAILVLNCKCRLVQISMCHLFIVDGLLSKDDKQQLQWLDVVADRPSDPRQHCLAVAQLWGFCSFLRIHLQWLTMHLGLFCFLCSCQRSLNSRGAALHK